MYILTPAMFRIETSGLNPDDWRGLGTGCIF